MCEQVQWFVSDALSIRYNALSWMHEKQGLAKVDVTSLFSAKVHGIESFLNTHTKLFHSYLNDYMQHGDCGRRNCSRRG